MSEEGGIAAVIGPACRSTTSVILCTWVCTVGLLTPPSTEMDCIGIALLVHDISKDDRVVSTLSFFFCSTGCGPTGYLTAGQLMTQIRSAICHMLSSEVCIEMRVYVQLCLYIKRTFGQAHVPYICSHREQLHEHGPCLRHDLPAFQLAAARCSREQRGAFHLDARGVCGPVQG